MSRFNTQIREATVPRYFVLGKGFATKRLAARALAKKEIACYAAIFALPAYRKLGELTESDRPIDALGLLFGDYHEDQDTPNFMEGSAYKVWIGCRSRELLNGSPVRIYGTTDEIHEDCSIDCWGLKFDPANPFPFEEEMRARLNTLGGRENP